MRTKSLATVTCHVITAYGNTAKNVIHAYHAGGERVVKLVEQRWNRALRASRPKLDNDVAKNANIVEHLLRDYSLKGLTLTSSGAQELVNKVVKLADAGVHSVAANASRFEDKTGAHALSALAQVALPGVVMLDTLACQIEQRTANLASKLAGDEVVVAPTVKRVRTVARKPRSTKIEPSVVEPAVTPAAAT